jgi:hypothetical protein
MPGEKPITVRFDILNVFDSTYFIRDGSGIGVFAPQFGPRRGYFIALRAASGCVREAHGERPLGQATNSSMRKK